MPRHFTLAEATALLPRLGALLLELQRRKRALEERQVELAAAHRQIRGNGRHAYDLSRAQADTQKLARELEQAIGAVRDLGCELKDIDMGLVDFRTRRAGREFYLCWHLREDTIRFWHELDTGFTGRRPLEELPEE